MRQKAHAADSTHDVISTGVDIQSSVDRRTVPRFTKAQFLLKQIADFFHAQAWHPTCGFSTLADGEEMCGTATGKEQNSLSNNRMKTSVAWRE
jgi:hypothetical protein